MAQNQKAVSLLFRRLVALGIGVLVFALDLLSKSLVKNTNWLHDQPLIEDFLTIQYATNQGIAFGFFHQLDSEWKTPILSVLAVLAVLFVVYYIWVTPPQEEWTFVALGLLLGGILGNFVDRLQDSSVIDFIKVHWGDRYAWPTFNLADSAITCGVVLILLTSLFGNRSQPEGGEQSSIQE